MPSNQVEAIDGGITDPTGPESSPGDAGLGEVPGETHSEPRARPKDPNIESWLKQLERIFIQETLKRLGPQKKAGRPS